MILQANSAWHSLNHIKKWTNLRCEIKLLTYLKICIITILICSVTLWRMLSPPSSRATLVEKNTIVMGLAIILYNQDNNSRHQVTQYMCMCTLVSYKWAHIINEVFVSWSSWSGCLGKTHSCHQMLRFINNGYFCLPVGLALSKSLIWMSLDKTSPVLITKSCEVVLVLTYNALLAFPSFMYSITATRYRLTVSQENSWGTIPYFGTFFMCILTIVLYKFDNHKLIQGGLGNKHLIH